MATLRTNYQDDILAAAMDGKRQYQMINNPNDTVSFVDVTDYTQNGDTFSAGDVNGIDTQVNANTQNIATNAGNIIINANNIASVDGKIDQVVEDCFNVEPRECNPSNLRRAIIHGNLEKYGYRIGDVFWGSGNSSTRYGYRLAHMWLYSTSLSCLAIIVNTNRLTSQWYSGASSTMGSFYGSTLRSTLINTVLPRVQSDFSTIFGGSNFLRQIPATYGMLSSGGGGASYYQESNCYITALTESQVYGAPIFSVDGYQQGEGCSQLDIFRKYGLGTFGMSNGDRVWLRSINRYHDAGVEGRACCASKSDTSTYSEVPLSYPMTSSGIVAGLVLLRG